MALHYPPVFINDYLQEKINEILGPDVGPFGLSIPFFPVGPSDIDQLTETFPEGMYAVYDRMFRMRRKAFPHIKEEQLLYYFYKMFGDPERLIDVVQIVADLMDNGDESAQDINAWTESKLVDVNGEMLYVKSNGGSDTKSFKPVFFHDIKVYQLEETRDIIDFGTARSYAGNKIIIDYCYHKN